MKRTMLFFLVTALATTVRAEILKVEISIFGMD